MKTGKFSRVPVIVGRVSNERSLFVWLGNHFVGTTITAATYEATIRAAYGLSSTSGPRS